MHDKGILNLDDVHRSLDAGVDGIVLSSQAGGESHLYECEL